ncbi:hypothetical protein GCM10027168_24940 [Streptomyces capparidis]
MSVLAVPRVHFAGHAAWDPATMNNNDQWPTFDFPHAELNWEFLSVQDPPITLGNVRDAFPRWARTPQRYEDGGGVKWCQPPGEWNYYGGNGWWLHTRDAQTHITGAQLELGGPVVDDDPLVGAVLDMTGDPYPGTDFPTSPRMLDVNPDASWTTCFLVRGLQIGTRTAPQSLLRGTVEPGTHMSSRWLHFGRNLNRTGRMVIAGVGGSVQQICLPKESLRITEGASAVLDHLCAALAGPDVKGLMVRFSAYLTRYFTDPRLPEVTGPDLTAQYTRLAELWEEQLSAGTTPMRNPAVSRVAGTLGLWMEREPATVPGGRFLGTECGVQVGEGRPFFLGPAAVEVHGRDGALYASVDLGNTVPEKDEHGAKEEGLGDLELVLAPDGGPGERTVATLTPDEYGTRRYQRTSGIVDLPVAAGVTAEDLAAGELRLRVAGEGNPPLLREARLTAHTDRRGIHIDQGESAALTVEVRDRGRIPAGPVRVLLQQYVPYPAPPAAGGDHLIRANPSQRLVRFRHATGALEEDVVLVADGTAEVTLEPVRPGFPVVVFFPYLEGGPRPVPPETIQAFGTSPSFLTAFYCCVRVLPFDDALPQEFRELLSATGNDPERAWRFVHDRILYLYDAIFPVMRYYGSLDLGDREAVERAIDQIVELCEPHLRHSTLYMPATRDLSRGKREVLRMYRDVLKSRQAAETLRLRAPAGSPAPSASPGGPA